jgi:D-alanyl-D-alanine carboxypeptidase (penicillin-binding protein 5/6)
MASAKVIMALAKTSSSRPLHLVSALVLLLGLVGQSPAQAIETEAKQAILVEWETNAVLLERAADELMPPSSMSKMMTAYLVFEGLRDGRLSLDDTLPVSKAAWKMGGSKMFVEVDTEVGVEDLLRGIIVQSGNDACLVVAEGLAGSDEAFAQEMTRRGREMGLTDTVFTNSTGWPDPEHLTTARDLALLARRTIEDFPDYYHYYAETTFTFNGIRQGNRNPLLYKNMGADGLKTGHTKAAGYGLTASVERGGRRLILVLNGLPSARTRSVEARRLVEWGFREFDNYPLFKAGETVAEAEVWLGDKAEVPLVAESDVVVTVPRKSRRNMRVSVSYDGPIPTPIEKGAVIAKLVVSAEGIEPIEVPLAAGGDVKRLGPIRKLGAVLKYLIWGSLK